MLEDMLNGNFWGYPPSHMSTGGIYRKFDDWPSNDGYRGNTFQPDGKQEFFTIYGDNYFRYSLFDLNVNANLVKYNYKGEYFDKLNKGEYDDYEENEFLFDDYGNKKAFNYSATLTANLHELFTPFVSYSKTERFPNLQELYFSQRTIAGVSNHLENEKAKTFQIGFNSFKENLVFDDDIFGFKAVYYNTKIDNYIHSVLKPPYNDHSDMAKKQQL